MAGRGPEGQVKARATIIMLSPSKGLGLRAGRRAASRGISQACLQFSSVMKPQPGNREQRGRAGAIAAMVQGLVLFKVKHISRKKEQMHGFYLQLKNILTTFPKKFS